MAGAATPQGNQAGPRLAETPRQLEVLDIIREHGVVTRAEIAVLLDASASQASRLTAPLIKRRVVTVEPRLPYVEGRPTELLTLAERGHYVVGLDIGGMAEDAGVANLRGTVVGAARAVGPLPESRSNIVDLLVELIERAIANAGVPDDEILGVGVGVRAIIDPVSGVISAGPETPRWSPVWADFDLRHLLAEALPWSNLVVDDTVRALASAERRYGDARGTTDFVYLLADSGIGATLMIDGRPYIGPSHLAGEVGHITLDGEGPICGCGRRGCVEMYASTSAMIARGQEIDSSIESIQHLIERADAGNDACRQILRAGGTALGRAIAILLNLLSPTLVVIRGRATASKVYMEHAKASAELESLAQPFRSVRIVSSAIELNAGAQGAATLILDELFDSTGPTSPRRTSPRNSPSFVMDIDQEGAAR